MSVTRIVNFINDRKASLLRLVSGLNVKHDHYADFGYPGEVSFLDLYKMYSRFGIAAAGVDKTARKTWETHPLLQDHARDAGQGKNGDPETELEKEIRKKFDALRMWARLKDADRISLVGGYAGVVFRFADGRKWNQPVGRLSGLDSLVGAQVVWKGQLTPQYETDQNSDNYNMPKMFDFVESAAEQRTPGQPSRSIQIHPDRVFIWSDDGTVNCPGLNEAGFNDLITLEKIIGSGGEGFWKNAKNGPVLQAEKDVSIANMAKLANMTLEQFRDRLDENVKEYQRGFDELLFLQGIEAKQLNVQLPSPEHFVMSALQSYTASIGCPLKVLIGSQSGERASTEDSDEWNQTNMSRRNNSAIPNIRDIVSKLERFNVLPAGKDWHLDWADLN